MNFFPSIHPNSNSLWMNNYGGVGSGICGYHFRGGSGRVGKLHYIGYPIRGGSGAFGGIESGISGYHFGGGSDGSGRGGYVNVGGSGGGILNMGCQNVASEAEEEHEGEEDEEDVQIIQESGSSKEKKNRGFWTRKEETILISGYLNVSCDSKKGRNQSRTTY